MNSKNYWNDLCKEFSIGMIMLLFLTNSAIAIPVVAQPASKPVPKRKIRWKPPTPPSSLGTPGNRGQGAAQRGDCKAYEGVKAIVPQTNKGIYWGQTVSDRPTIWFSAPKGLGEDLLMEIAVRQENGKPIAKQLFTAAKTPAGVFSVPFPDKISLQENRTYLWEVVFYCDQEMPDKSLIVQGQVQRLAAPKQLPSTPLEQVQALAQQGIWYDALTLTGNTIRSEPQSDLKIAWSELLETAGMRDRINVPIQECCQLLTPASR